MPELPEVETTRRGITRHVTGKKITGVIIRDRRLRRPIPPRLGKKLRGRKLISLKRRAKYLILQFDRGALIVHLGMTGSLRLLSRDTPADKHDHADLIFSGNRRLRFRDPRRFGCILWTGGDPLDHELLRNLGPEPLGREFTATYLYTKTRKRTQAIKALLMDSRILAGVGNIYANEALFAAGILPNRKAGKLTQPECARLVTGIKRVLKNSITKGGTTLRDYVNGAGEPGYFWLDLKVYGRAGEPCRRCHTHIKARRQGQRSSYYCPRCQK